jgi:5-(carboxyamino)imidazole ribonucleotide mutase
MTRKVAIIMGSSSDANIMSKAADALKTFDIEYDFLVVSAHRSPEWMFEFAKSVEQRNIAVIIAGAGGSAHLPGMMAALTIVPVIGVPIRSSNSLDGWDSLMSIVQMPNDVPVATVAVDGAHNAGILAAQILSVSNPDIAVKMTELKHQNKEKVKIQNQQINNGNF